MIHMSPHKIEIRQKFKDATIIFMVVHYEFECVRLTLLNLLNIIERMDKCIYSYC